MYKGNKQGTEHGCCFQFFRGYSCGNATQPFTMQGPRLGKFLCLVWGSLFLSNKSTFSFILLPFSFLFFFCLGFISCILSWRDVVAIYSLSLSQIQACHTCTYVPTKIGQRWLLYLFPNMNSAPVAIINK